MKELLKLKKYVKRYRWAILGGLLALIAIDLLQLAIPRILKLVVDHLAAGNATAAHLARYGLWLVGIALAIGFGRFFWRFLIIGSARRVERELRADLYRHLTTLDIAYFDETKTGDLMAHATNDINAVRMSLGFGLVIITDIVILGLTSLFMLFGISPRLTLIVLIPLPALSALIALFGQMIRKKFEVVQKSFADLTELVRENISGIRVVKLYVQEGAENDRFGVSSRDYLKKNMGLVRIWGSFFPMIMVIATLSQGICFWSGGRMVVFGAISIGDYVAFSAYLGILIWPMIAIGQAINVFQRGAASQGRINRILETRPQITDAPATAGASAFAEINRGVEFKNITCYHQGKTVPALADVSFKLESRQMLGVTGAIGSGKSTLVNVLLRLYETQQGEIQIDGRNVREYSLGALRSNAAYVPQDSFLFSDTLAENISFGRPGMINDQDALERVCRLASVHDEIMAFPRRYQTIVGERGVTLSGGQKQRVALARALLLEKPILILDDSLSAVDADTERRILSNIRSELDCRTAIVISHRIFAIQDADLIIVLDQGRIVERGRHESLLAKKGKYHEMFTLQQLEQQIAKT
ncbi:MAG: ABC transporter ATP-binding protein [Candidatus Edwardsbacteria bacterium]|nr:ABC transporter ATP-binding protein [Candidatus Edwardsbacteria bacterium]